MMLRVPKSARRVAFAFLALIIGFACTEGVLAPARVGAVVVSGGGASLRLGQAAQLGVSLKSTEGFTLPTTGVTWTSSDASVATVSATGQVTAVKRGTATITATAFSVTGTAAVSVIGVQAVTIPQDTLAVVVQAQGTVTATVTADPGVSVPASWVARDTSVAQVDAAGRITARKLGTTWVVASAEVAADSVRVVVTPVPVLPPASGAAAPVTTSVLGGAVTLTIPPGATTAPALTVAPAPVAPADDRIPAGLAYVFGPAGSQFASPLTLSVAYDPAQIPAAKRPLLRLHLVNGTTVTEVPGSAVDLVNNRVTAPVTHFSTYAILVPSDPTQVAITAGAGQTTFVEYEVPTAPSVTVKDAQGRPVPRAKVSFDITAGGGRFRNGATQSSDTATTDANGVATLGAKWRLGGSAGANTLTIKAFTAAGAQATTTTITATAQANPVARVVVTPASASLAVGATQQLSATLYDARDTVLTGRPITWMSSDTAVATVSSSGLLTPSVYLGEESRAVTVSGSVEGRTGLASFMIAPLPPASSALGFGAGTSFSCAIAQDARTYCWGSNISGQLGTGDSQSAATPVAVSAAVSFVRLSVGSDHACGLDIAGNAYCWGRGKNYPGETGGKLGNGSESDKSTPTLVAGGLRFISISAGYTHTCGLTVGGDAHCWGHGFLGQLGDGTTLGRSVPTRVAGPAKLRQLSAGLSYTCGLDEAGRAWCWGFNGPYDVGSGYGVLGDGSSSSRVLPTLVAGGLLFSEISAGIRNTCGLLSGSGIAYCWGVNQSAQLGDGTNVDRLVPTQVLGDNNFTSISSVGTYHKCAVAIDSAALCWGVNRSGELGDGTLVQRLGPTPVAGNVRFRAVLTGEQHSCGLALTNEMYCWGANESGQLGNGGNSGRSTPAVVQGGILFGLPRR